MQLGIKLFYDLLPQDEIKELFPNLPEEYNKEYIIKVNDTSKEYIVICTADGTILEVGAEVDEEE